MFKFRKKREKGHEYNLTYDNLAFLAAASHKYVVEIYSIIGIYPVAAPCLYGV